MTVKALLNRSEEITHAALSKVCERNSAKVFSKIRIADVLTIEGSGLSREEYSYCLRAHFDFVVSDFKNIPLFAVEFDGPSHKKPTQAAHDGIKNRICELLHFPILRVNSRHLAKKYRNLDLLTWFVEVWFFEDAVNQAQSDGTLPQDDYFDPFMVINLPGHKNTFPLWLGAGPRLKIQNIQKLGQCRDFAPSEWMGRDSDGNFRGLMWLRISESTGVMVLSAMRAQQFPVIETELLSEIMVFELLDKLQQVLNGKEKPALLVTIAEALAKLREHCIMSHCAGFSNSLPGNSDA
jgi:hypothetical protein